MPKAPNDMNNQLLCDKLLLMTWITIWNAFQ